MAERQRQVKSRRGSLKALVAGTRQNRSPKPFMPITRSQAQNRRFKP